MTHNFNRNQGSEDMISPPEYRKQEAHFSAAANQLNIPEFHARRDGRPLFPVRPPQLNSTSRIEDSLADNWMWLTYKSERGFQASITQKKAQPSRRVAEHLGKSFAMDKFSCFVPRAVLEAVVDEKIKYSDDFDIIVDRCLAAVVFCDASGFTAVTEALDKQENGAE
eukprot:Gregarina_sp_Poly_1__2145@NODE_156_length_12377_cov_161_699350_g138_i0_p6_GENE_NODE_156_length_12377_cov_161_699350_g138_i0NODE_156_length_12377_cov_161_699350_g138_i0_p6_ORF_typecomplete_len167_score25_35_NODE_156_length_12377_cov_161_699350_g138_i031423642